MHLRRRMSGRSALPASPDGEPRRGGARPLHAGWQQGGPPKWSSEPHAVYQILIVKRIYIEMSVSASQHQQLCSKFNS